MRGECVHVKLQDHTEPPKKNFLFSIIFVFPVLMILLQQKPESQWEKCHTGTMIHSEVDKTFKMNTLTVCLLTRLFGKERLEKQQTEVVLDES